MEHVPVPAFEDLPLIDLPPVLSPAERARRYRPHQEQRRLERVCQRDGLALGHHPYCVGCGALSGPAHPIAPFLSGGKCPGCRG